MKKTSKTRGRPKNSTVRVQFPIRMSQQEQAAIAKAAKQAGKPVSTFVRETVLAKINCQWIVSQN